MEISERFAGVAWRPALVATLALCAVAPLMRAVPASAHTASSASSTEWPTQWEGRALRPVALSEVEQRFASRFPGRIARLTDGRQTLVWREVQRPTRMLHPAADCYRGLGYRIEAARLEHDEAKALWRCFVATRDGRSVRVCERIVGADGASFTDTSSWFWAAQLGQSAGPWAAITIARAL